MVISTTESDRGKKTGRAGGSVRHSLDIFAAGPYKKMTSNEVPLADRVRKSDAEFVFRPRRAAVTNSFDFGATAGSS